MAEISRVVLFPFSKALVEEFNDMPCTEGMQLVSIPIKNPGSSPRYRHRLIPITRPMALTVLRMRRKLSQLQIALIVLQADASWFVTPDLVRAVIKRAVWVFVWDYSATACTASPMARFW